MFAFWRRLRRDHLLAEPFPERFRDVIRKSVPLLRALPPADADKLEALVRILVAEKHFEGAGGLELSEEICISIAARACLLILHRVELDDEIYPGLVSIVVYPSTFVVKRPRSDGVLVTEGEQPVLGESWSSGLVVLSWDAAVLGATTPDDGHDVVLHEFAHQLDGQDGTMDGAPVLSDYSRYAGWTRVFRHEYQRLRFAIESGRPADIDEYAATNPPEFFAVVTEAFFETPEALEREHPKLYAELRDFYRLDPAELVRTANAESAKAG